MRGAGRVVPQRTSRGKTERRERGHCPYGPPTWVAVRAISYTEHVLEQPSGPEWVGLTNNALPVDDALVWATTPGSGAVVCFLGVVRDHSEGREGVVGMSYEAYEDEARHRLTDVAGETRRRWPAVERLAILHRVGELALSEPSVVVVASAPHRSEAFDAARFAIDTLKATVPIWKREHWAGGSDWGARGQPVRSVHQPPVSTGGE